MWHTKKKHAHTTFPLVVFFVSGGQRHQAGGGRGPAQEVRDYQGKQAGLFRCPTGNISISDRFHQSVSLSVPITRSVTRLCSVARIWKGHFYFFVVERCIIMSIMFAS